MCIPPLFFTACAQGTPDLSSDAVEKYLEADYYSAGFVINVGDRASAENAYKTAEELLKQEFPVFENPNIKTGSLQASLLWYSAAPRLEIVKNTDGSMQTLGCYFFLSEEKYTAPDWGRELSEALNKL
ncbi:MAG: hypothetical protein NC223_10355 [Butyrivibrio sp.]|nr:hypothetical protein [Butyrivibrio sp.]